MNKTDFMILMLDAQVGIATVRIEDFVKPPTGLVHKLSRETVCKTWKHADLVFKSRLPASLDPLPCPESARGFRIHEQNEVFIVYPRPQDLEATGWIQGVDVTHPDTEDPCLAFWQKLKPTQSGEIVVRPTEPMTEGDQK